METAILKNTNPLLQIKDSELDQASIESIIFRNSQLISDIEKQQNEMYDKRKSEPFMIFQNWGMRIRSEALSLKKKRLQTKNEKLKVKLNKSQVKKSPQKLNITVRGQAPQSHPVLPYKSITTRNSVELEYINDKLDKLIQRKSELLIEAHHSADGKLSIEKQEELDEIIRQEADLLNQVTMLETESSNEKLSFKPYLMESEGIKAEPETPVLEPTLTLDEMFPDEPTQEENHLAEIEEIRSQSQDERTNELEERYI